MSKKMAGEIREIDVATHDSKVTLFPRNDAGMTRAFSINPQRASRWRYRY